MLIGDIATNNARRYPDKRALVDADRDADLVSGRRAGPSPRRLPDRPGAGAGRPGDGDRPQLP